ncbi:phage protein [Streptococcus equi subsp. zooepidemicus Sz105]|uniref:hypothetical protein n=1 Tax=Streptococcus equi TaxID=1336 RepID=UPI0005B91CC2|nr:hypothetical protein [Streptococcus equi]KIS12095.1 phage protein [Streptococcus equi subsp. zooepidemicus Sz105]MDI5988526.1 hypothetical protein [Streptococcus equi subsp. zooepidemicus]
MKKTLLVILALGSMSISTTVRADENLKTQNDNIKYDLDGIQQKIYYDENKNEINVDTFYTGDETITVRMPQGWGVKLYRQLEGQEKELVEQEYDCYEIEVGTKDVDGRNIPITKARYRDGYRLNYESGIYSISLTKNSSTNQSNNLNTEQCPVKEKKQFNPLKKGEKLTFVFTGDDGIYAGTLVYKDSQTIAEEKQKIEEQQRKQNEQKQEQQRRQQKLLEDNMLKHIRENDHKTWYQRLGDNIEDTWANFKGWWRG